METRANGVNNITREPRPLVARAFLYQDSSVAMDRVLAAGVVPVLLSAVLLPCALSSSLYNVSLGNREGSNGNTVTATCMGVFSDPSRLTWYYNGSDGHRCLCEATRTNLSIVIRLVPDCEGYLQCGTSETLSRSVPLYGK